MPDVFVFAGPTAFDVPQALLTRPGLTVLPPAARRDVPHLLDAHRTPGVIVLCDGTFGTTAAVGHGELCDALDAGWQVWGVSSLGAIRACEMRSEGMLGFGEVYRRLCTGAGLPDDEMCLIHWPEAPFRPMTEALVNVRHALDVSPVGRAMTPRARRSVIASLRRRWFGDRTFEAVRRALEDDGGLDAANAAALADWIAAHRIKSLDLIALLTDWPWEAH